MRNRIDSAIRHFLVFLMGVLVINVVWQVFSRYILNDPSTFTDELARILLIWVSILGAAYFSGKNMHIAINVLPSRLNDRNRVRLNIFIRLIIIAFVLCVLVIGGGMVVYNTTAYLQLTPILQLPMGLVYFVGPLSGVLIIYYKISDIMKMLEAGADNVEKDEEFKGSI